MYVVISRMISTNSISRNGILTQHMPGHIYKQRARTHIDTFKRASVPVPVFHSQHSNSLVLFLNLPTHPLLPLSLPSLPSPDSPWVNYCYPFIQVPFAWEFESGCGFRGDHGRESVSGFTLENRACVIMTSQFVSEGQVAILCSVAMTTARAAD